MLSGIIRETAADSSTGATQTDSTKSVRFQAIASCIRHLCAGQPRNPSLRPAAQRCVNCTGFLQRLRAQPTALPQTGPLMSRTEMESLASPKFGGCFLKGSQSYNRILDMLDSCHVVLQQTGSSGRPGTIFFLQLQELDKACTQYMNKNNGDSKRKRAVKRLHAQIQLQFKHAGRAYYTARQSGQVDNINLNDRARFASNLEKIVCRHLALQEIFERQLEDQCGVDPPGHRADRRAAQRGTPQQMAHLTEHLECRYDEVKRTACKNYAVEHTQWGQFFHEIFSGMPPSPSRRYMLMRSGNHVMAVRLCIKGAIGQEKYVINFYDPNTTLTDKRCTADNLDQVRNWQIGSFLANRILSE